MQWYSGGISEAIALCKAKESIFVVYIEGPDEKSQQITMLLDSEEISNKLGSDNFVAIKLEANSVPHQQFSQIYKQSSVPSIYFIAKNGSPLEIITEPSGKEIFSKSLDDILQKGGIVNKPAMENFIKNEQESQKPSNVVCENGVCTIKKDEPSTSTTPEGDQGISTEDKVERAKKLLEIKRQEKEKEEEEKERQKEIERRKLGQNVQQMKRWQEDQDLRQLKEEREKEKRELAADRARVLAQIAQDKAERASKFSNAILSRDGPQASSTPVNSPRPSNSNTAILQFKLPDGSSKTKEFPSSDTLETVVNYIKDQIQLPFSRFSLSMTFPRRDFTTNDYSQTLADLQLTPNAVILVLPLNQGVVQTNRQGGLSGFVWTLLTPFLNILNFIKSFIFGGTGNQAPDNPPASGSSYSGGGRGNSVVHIRSRMDLDRRLREAGVKLVVMDFFATWCGPCRMIAPVLDQLAREYSNVVFLKIDVDENQDIAQSYGVSAMPTFVFYKNRQEVTRFSGADQYQLKNTISRYR